jgi:hypothetical protein
MSRRAAPKAHGTSAWQGAGGAICRRALLKVNGTEANKTEVFL